MCDQLTAFNSGLPKPGGQYQQQSSDSVDVSNKRKSQKQTKIPEQFPVKKVKRDRFKGMSEEEVMQRGLPDYLRKDLDMFFVGINPGLAAAYTGQYYTGPGNHFWKCLYLSGFVDHEMTCKDDYKLMDYGIGFTNMVARTTKGSKDLSKAELKEGGKILTEKVKEYRPKLLVFNGKISYEVYSSKKKFHFGVQPELVEGTNTKIWVMPSSSARCAQLPRAVDKVPFFEALKRYCDFLRGNLTGVKDEDFVFTDVKLIGWKKKETNDRCDDEDNDVE